MVGLGHGAIWAALIFGALILLVMVATLLQRRTMARGRHSKDESPGLETDSAVPVFQLPRRCKQLSTSRGLLSELVR